MKKLVSSVLFCIMMLFAVSTSASLVAEALIADNAIIDEIYLEIEEVTASEAAVYNTATKDAENILAGDYKISFCIANTTGFAATGARIAYDPALCSPVLNAGTGKPTRLKGAAASNLTLKVSANLEENWLGFATIAVACNSKTDGALVSFFLRLNENVPAEMISDVITDINIIEWDRIDHSVPDYTVNKKYFSFRKTLGMIGDIDSNGVVNAYDAHILSSILNKSATHSYSADYTVGWYTWKDSNKVTHYYPKSFIANTGDVNRDGFIDNTDVTDMLQYFIDYFLKNKDLENYTGLIGTTNPVYETVPFTQMN